MIWLVVLLHQYVSAFIVETLEVKSNFIREIIDRNLASAASSAGACTRVSGVRLLFEMKSGLTHFLQYVQYYWTYCLFCGKL